jgi:hypothetical protein
LVLLIKEDLMIEKDRYIQRLLENERLTRDLEDEAAKALIQWGIDLVKDTDFEDERSLHQVERAMRRASSLVGKMREQSMDDNEAGFQALISELTQIPGFEGLSIDPDTKQAFLSRGQLQPQDQRLMLLKRMVENAAEKGREKSTLGHSGSGKGAQSLTPADRGQGRERSSMGRIDRNAASESKRPLSSSDNAGRKTQSLGRQVDRQDGQSGLKRVSQKGESGGSGASFSVERSDETQNLRRRSSESKREEGDKENQADKKSRMKKKDNDEGLDRIR